MRPSPHQPARTLYRSLPIGGAAEELITGLTTHTPVGIFMSDAGGDCRFVNERWCALTGLSFDQALGSGWAAALHPDDRERVASEWEHAAAEGRDSVISYRFLRPDDTVVWIEGYASAFRDEEGGLVGWVGSCLDVTAYELAEQALIQERALFSAAFENAPIGMALVSPQGQFLRANAVLCDSLGYTPAELYTLGFPDITHADDVEADVLQAMRLIAGEFGFYRRDKRYVRKDGSIFWAALSVSLIRDEKGAPVHFVAHIEDIEERKLREQELRTEAERDPLTGVLNRRRFQAELERSLRLLALDPDAPASLILVDIDHFKEINDSLGHQAGDDALIQFARTLERRLRDTDVVARLGGDEFAVVARTRSGEQLGRELLESVRAATFDLCGEQRRLSASAGVVAIHPARDATATFEAADRALYRAKNSGRDRLAIG